MRLTIGFGIAAAGVAVLDALMWVIKWSFILDSTYHWGDEIEVLTSIQAFGIWPIEAALFLVFFILFLRNYNKQ